MKVLHYALGFPPYRTGGLTKYCMDLMLEEQKQGLEVGLLWPGKINFFNKKVKIKEKKSWNNIKSFELINPLPVSLDEGIIDIDAYTKKIDEEVYYNFLKKDKPDVIHIHSLMGLHKEFLSVAEKLKIRMVFTSHDYFGICPRVTLFHNGKLCENDHECSDCVECNLGALSLKKIMILQSPAYRLFKNTKIIKKIRKYHRKKFFDEDSNDLEALQENKNVLQEYSRLRKYYISMLEMIDFIHFNSNISKKVYERYITPQNSKVISITHGDIHNNYKKKNFNREKLKIAYLGPAKSFKGFHFLIKKLDDLWEREEKSFELHIYSETVVEREYITHKQEGYVYDELESIFDNTDLLIVPSQWYETFGFTVLEALSYGVPVLVSENVGAKDIIQKIDNNFVFNNNEFDLFRLDCKKFNRKLILMDEIIKTEKQHVNEILQVYKEK